MEFQYELTLKDLIEFSYYVSRKRTKVQRMIKYVLTGVGAFVILLVCLIPTARVADVKVPLTILVLSLMLLWTLRSKWFLKYFITMAYKKGRGANDIGTIALSFKEDGLLMKTKQGETNLFWSAFTMLKENTDYLFLFINKKKAVVIPKRIFLLPQEEYDVKSFIERKLA